MSALDSASSAAALAGADTSDAAASRFLHNLVATSSVSGTERAAVARFVAAANALGLEAMIDKVGNGVACSPAAAIAEHSIVLLCHIDTVPGNIPVRIENGVLHGRGSVDAKGPLATMLFAAARARVPENVAVYVAAAVGEETADSIGANHLASVLAPDACIVAEPSGWDGVTLGYKGCLTVRAHADCGSAHSAGPDPSAPDTLHAWWNRVMEWITTINSTESSIFDQLQASIRSWQYCGDGLNDQATMTVNFRLPLSMTLTGLRRKLQRLARPNIKLEFFGGESAHCSPRDDLVVRTLSAAIRCEGAQPRHKRKTGTADLNVVAPHWQCPIAAYGPGDSSLDHTAEERLTLEEFHRAIRVVTQAIELMAEALLTEAKNA